MFLVTPEAQSDDEMRKYTYSNLNENKKNSGVVSHNNIIVYVENKQRKLTKYFKFILTQFRASTSTIEPC